MFVLNFVFIIFIILIFHSMLNFKLTIISGDSVDVILIDASGVNVSKMALRLD